jgi:hypothetical protein
VYSEAAAFDGVFVEAEELLRLRFFLPPPPPVPAIPGAMRDREDFRLRLPLIVAPPPPAGVVESDSTNEPENLLRLRVSSGPMWAFNEGALVVGVGFVAFEGGNGGGGRLTLTVEARFN